MPTPDSPIGARLEPRRREAVRGVYVKAACLAFAVAVVTGTGVAAQSPMPMPVEPFSGYVEGYGGYGWREGLFDVPGSFTGGGGAVRLSYMFMSPWSIQADVFGNQFNGSGSVFTYGELGGALHLSKRGPNHLIGVFGGYDMVDGGQLLDFSTFFYGAEGQLHLGNFTIYGQAGGLAGVQTDGINIGPEYMFARLVGRAFFTPNTKLEGGVTVFKGHPFADGGLADTTTVWNVKLEHQFNGPLSAFVSADTMNSTFVVNSGQTMPYSRVMAGLKISFGAGSLQDANGGGATLDTPDFAPLGLVRQNGH